MRSARTSARLNSRMGLISDSRLMPLARTAVSSWSALNRPNTSSVAVNMPIGQSEHPGKWDQQTGRLQSLPPGLLAD